GTPPLRAALDAELTRLVREWFDLPRAPRLRIRTGDARAVVAAAAPGAWEVVVRDVFSAGRVPAHVRTVEAARDVHRTLAPGGLYLVNLADHPPLREARAEVATLSEVFEHVLVIVDPAILRGRRYGNLVLAASAEPMPAAEVARALLRLPLPVRALHGVEVANFRGGVPAEHDPAAPPDERAAGEG
ncbi:MAG: spermidine synthase, partial [Georgenia sp.]